MLTTQLPPFTIPNRKLVVLMPTLPLLCHIPPRHDGTYLRFIGVEGGPDCFTKRGPLEILPWPGI